MPSPQRKRGLATEEQLKGMRDLGFALPQKIMEIGKCGPVPFLHLLRSISRSPINAVLRNPAGPQEEKDKAAAQRARSAKTETSGSAILICISFT